MHLIWLVNFFKNRKLFSLEELVLTIPSLTNELICWLQKLKYCGSKEVFNSLQNLSQNLAITPVISEVFLFFTISYQETTAEPFFFLWLALTIQKLWVLQNLSPFIPTYTKKVASSILSSLITSFILRMFSPARWSFGLEIT